MTGSYHKDGKCAVYRAVKSGECATVREVAAKAGLAVGTTHHHLRNLIDEGHIVQVPKQFRAVDDMAGDYDDGWNQALTELIDDVLPGFAGDTAELTTVLRGMMRRPL
jgi:AcrR family transcriptional regulator